MSIGSTLVSFSTRRPRAVTAIMLIVTLFLLSVRNDKIWQCSITSTGRMIMPILMFLLIAAAPRFDRSARWIAIACIAGAVIVGVGLWRFPVPAYHVT